MDWSCVVYGNVLEFQLHVWLKNWNWLYLWTWFHGRCIACLISGLWMKALPVILYFMPFETIAELRGYCPSHGLILCSYESLRLKHCLNNVYECCTHFQLRMVIDLVVTCNWWNFLWSLTSFSCVLKYSQTEDCQKETSCIHRAAF